MKTNVSFKDFNEEEFFKIQKAEYLLKCASCDKKLITIHSATEIDIMNEVKCNCPYCHDSSFITKVKGKFFIDSMGHDVINIEGGKITICLKK